MGSIVPNFSFHHSRKAYLLSKMMPKLVRSSILARLQHHHQRLLSQQLLATPIYRCFSETVSASDRTPEVVVTFAKNDTTKRGGASSVSSLVEKDAADGVKVSACGDVDAANNEDEMEEEEMFVDAHESFGHKMAEWGGPRRGGRLPEPTRFGDWERKGRCTDF